MIMRIKWRQQPKINSENEAAPSASKLAFTLAAATCTEFLQILRTASLHPKMQRLPSSLLRAPMNEERWLRQHAIIAAFQGQLEPRKKEETKKGCGVRGNLPPLFTSSKTIQRAVERDSSVTVKKTLPMRDRSGRFHADPTQTSSLPPLPPLGNNFCLRVE